VLVNHDGFWDPLLTLIEHQVASGLVPPEHRALLTVVPDAAAAIAAIASHTPPPLPPDKLSRA